MVLGVALFSKLKQLRCFFYLPEKDKCRRYDDCTEQSGRDAEERYAHVHKSSSPSNVASTASQKQISLKTRALITLCLPSFNGPFLQANEGCNREVVVSTSELKKSQLIKHDKPYHRLVPATTFPQADPYLGLCRFK